MYILPRKKLSYFPDNSSNFSDSLFNSFSASICFALFELIILLKLNSLLSKSILFTKLAISVLLAKFPCFNLASKLSIVNLLNSEIVIYLS